MDKKEGLLEVGRLIGLLNKMEETNSNLYNSGSTIQPVYHGENGTQPLVLACYMEGCQ